MSNLSKLFSSTLPILIDGGLGSVLEDVFQVDTASSLWSSEALIKHPDSVIEAHIMFLRAGARLIETVSYQGSFSTYARAGYSQDEAIRLMRSSITLAAEARSRFATEADENESEDLLTAFHLERLRAYASDKETWRAVDAIAFETIPLAREVKAIRRAVAALEDELALEERKPWWVCTVYPDGEIPEEHPGGGGGRLGVKDVLAAYFGAPRYAVPDAFGMNCTAMAHVASAVTAVSDALAETSVARSSVGVLKPNGGQTYDMDTLKWGWHGGETRLQGDNWAKQLGDIVYSAVAKGVWGGILAGGCCKAGEEELRLLSKALQSE
ncbi:Homocysteine S-methyltransferase [Russula aff. rugulosa BPL654]|nr:Homocysteine S-methyltransferase [Russula aff. rugulosa BPL654]